MRANSSASSQARRVSPEPSARQIIDDSSPRSRSAPRCAGAGARDRCAACSRSPRGSRARPGGSGSCSQCGPARSSRRWLIASKPDLSCARFSLSSASPSAMYVSQPMIGRTPDARAFSWNSAAPNRLPWSVMPTARCPSDFTWTKSGDLDRAVEQRVLGVQVQMHEPVFRDHASIYPPDARPSHRRKRGTQLTPTRSSRAACS